MFENLFENDMKYLVLIVLIVFVLFCLNKRENMELTTDGRCGPAFNNKMCPLGQCCSAFGWCGGNVKDMSGEHCTSALGFNGQYDGKYKPNGYDNGDVDATVREYDGYNPVLYGVDGKYLASVHPKTVGKFTCLPSGFQPINGNPVLPVEDPVPGTQKRCYLKQGDKNVPSSYIVCGNDGQVCSYSGENDVYYGVSGNKLMRISKENMVAKDGKFSCVPQEWPKTDDRPQLPLFGDPLPNIQKSCYTMPKKGYLSNGDDVNTIQNTTPQNCHNECLKNSNCGAWTMDTNSKSCWLKNKSKPYNVYGGDPWISMKI